MKIEVLKGEALAGAIEDVARLRIAVFAEWPYLYQGDMSYEQAYLAPYLSSDAAVLVGAFEAGRLVGAATGMPIEDHEDDFSSCLPQDMKASDVFYCAESVLLPEFRGRGVGHAFFDHREAQARRLGDLYSVFCSVIRPQDHPARPSGARSHAGFWAKRGYAPLEGAVARFSWCDIGAQAETEKNLQLWMRRL